MWYGSQANLTIVLARLRQGIHWLAHKTHHNYGHVETFWHEDNTLMVGFRCNCGRLMDVVPCVRLFTDDY